MNLSDVMHSIVNTNSIVFVAHLTIAAILVEVSRYVDVGIFRILTI